MKKYIFSVLLLAFGALAMAQNAEVTPETLNNDTVVPDTTAVRIDSLLKAKEIEDSLYVDSLRNNTTAHYINAFFGLGANELYYTPLDAKWGLGFGGDFRLQYQLMFNQNWGFSFGVQASVYQASAVYNYTMTQYNLTHPDNGLLYDLKTTFKDWKENQMLVQVEVPIMFNFRAPFGKKQKNAFLLGAGFAVGFPVYNSYKTVSGEYQLTGYFPSTNVEYSNLVNHGFISSEYGVEGVSNFKTANLGALLDLGFTFAMTTESDFYLGLYGGYYFINSINYVKQDLVLDPAQGGKYVGTFCSDRVREVHPFNAGIRLGFRFRVDKANQRAKDMQDKLADARKNLKELEELKAKLKRDSIAAADSAAAAAARLAAAGKLNAAERQRAADEEAAKLALDRELKALRAEHDSVLRKKKEIEERKRIAGHINSIAHFDSSQDFPYISEESQAALRRLAELMNENKNVYVMVFGHADNSGDPDKNIIYGQRRAVAMKKILVQYGADPERIVCVSRGDLDPVADNSTPEGRALNRRAEIDIQER